MRNNIITATVLAGSLLAASPALGADFHFVGGQEGGGIEGHAPYYDANRGMASRP